MAEFRSVWRRSAVSVWLSMLGIACSSHTGGTMQTPAGYRTPPLAGTHARTGVETGGAQVAAERGTAEPQLTVQEAEQLAASAYIYAYPLMVMDVTKNVMTAVPRPDPRTIRAPLNQAVSATGFPDPKLTTVVRPNFDTLYTSAWLDLATEPVVVSVPDMGDRYYLLPMLDAWTNVVAVPGTRTTRMSKADYIVTGPNFRGTVPADMKQIKSPTRYVWMIGRIAAKPGADEKAVRELESQINVAPLSRFKDPSWRTLAASYGRVDTQTKPPDQVARMTPQQFFGRFSELTRDNPPRTADQPLLQSIAKLGIVPGKQFDVSSLSPELQQAVARGMSRAQKTIEGKVTEMTQGAGWHSMGNDLGQFGTNYTSRAVVALAGLGANLTADAVYPQLSSDATGQPLNGSNRYQMRFTQPPPVKAFWSLTVYDKDGYVVKNSIDRYSIGSQHELSRGPDGSVTILLQPDQPNDVEQRKNWLPTPRGEAFNVTLRLYQPEQSVIDGSWKAPVAERVK